jgi:hypothetical protein
MGYFFRAVKKRNVLNISIGISLSKKKRLNHLNQYKCVLFNLLLKTLGVDGKMKTETTSDMKYIIGTVSFVFAAIVFQVAMTDATFVPMPDLIIRNITFLEYNMTFNNTNVTFVNVTTVVKNIGNEPAGNSTTRLNRLSVTVDKFTPGLLANQVYDFSDSYQCTVGHNYNATADVFNVVNESHEDNNKKTVFIDCVV